jgi:hypothetical protein
MPDRGIPPNNTHLDVCHAVVVEVGRRREPLKAHRTLVRLLSAVDPSVGVQGRGRAEAFSANHAHVRFFT